MRPGDASPRKPLLLTARTVRFDEPDPILHQFGVTLTDEQHLLSESLSVTGEGIRGDLVADGFGIAEPVRVPEPDSLVLDPSPPDSTRRILRSAAAAAGAGYFPDSPTAIPSTPMITTLAKSNILSPLGACPGVAHRYTVTPINASPMMRPARIFPTSGLPSVFVKSRLKVASLCAAVARRSKRRLTSEAGQGK